MGKVSRRLGKSGHPLRAVTALMQYGDQDNEVVGRIQEVKCEWESIEESPTYSDVNLGKLKRPLTESGQHAANFIKKL